jgi:hypothetical protein
MRAVVITISGALGCFAVAGFAPARAAAVEEPKAVAAAPDLSGRWLLNKDLSDDAHEKVRQSMERPRGGYGPGPSTIGPGSAGGGRLGLPPPTAGDDDPGESMQAIFNPAEELSIYQGQPDIVIDEKFSRRRTLHADGRKYKADNGSSEVKTAWKESRLVVETRGFRGRKTTETWELNTTGTRLTALVKLESGYGKPVTIKRVYEKAGDAPPPGTP